MIFQRIIELYPSTKLHVSNSPWKICSCFTRTRVFSIFKFLKSRIRNCASLSLLRNLITRLHVKFLLKLRKNYKNIAFRGRPAASVL